MPLHLVSVDEHSPAQRLGLEPGCTLLAIDGNPLNDALDYQFYTSAPHFTLTICQNGAQQQISVEKGEYEPFGCNFKTYLGDEKHSCANHCMFCFIDQLPPGMREPLYFKDDDERLSFLYGNYITMTNLTDREVERIIKLHISPIFISVHTTNPQLRVRMMANKRAAETLRYLDVFAKGGIDMNCQLVLCRGINDGDELRRTLDIAEKDAIEIYVDGELKATNNSAGGEFRHMNTNVDKRWFGIGADPNPNDNGQISFNGEVVIARIYDDPINADQVHALWKLVK